ncbi:hypothetical protein [Pseudooceanicola sp.]|uniref:hypothetical protein n=1 Tax=Pseudooceanicola sp. TaxID=1914328 RepID=UPI004058C019
MADMTDISDEARQLEELLDRGFGTGGQGLATALRKAGRRLPRRIRRAGQAVVQAEMMAGHPKLVRQIDRRRLGQEAARLRSYLEEIDPKARRIDMALTILRSLALNALLLGALLLALAHWRGWL